MFLIQINMNNSTLADSLGMEFHSLSKRLKKMELPYKSNEILQEVQLIDVLKVYSTPHPRRSGEVVLRAKELLETKNYIQTNINITNNYKKPSKGRRRAPKRDQLQDEKILKYRPIVFIVFLMIIAYQVEHTTILAMELAKTGELWIDLPLSLLAGLSIQLTAFLMTVNNGSKWILIAYGFGEFILSMIYFAPWDIDDASLVTWASAFMISTGSAFTIYSYSDLLTSNK